MKGGELSGHFVCHAAHLQCRTGSARTSLGPKWKEEDRGKKEKKTMNSVATLFSMQPIYNAARALHALRSNQ
jgi:hypothetical protein